MLYFSLLTVSLFSFWLLLSGYWDNTLLLIFGLLSSLFAAYIGAKIKQQNEFELDLGFFVRFPGYLVWLAGQIWQANVDTARRIWMPGRFPISPAVSRVKTSQKTPFGQSIYANSITITPGTVTIEMHDDSLTVHALSHHSIEELNRGAMDSKVSILESGK